MDSLAQTHQQLTAAVQALAADGQWAKMLATAAKFPRYSASNVLLIMLQRPDATKVAGLRTWNNLGRRVIKGEKSIAILAPCTYPTREPEKTQAGQGNTDPANPRPMPTDDLSSATETRKPKQLRGFRVVRVFDICQTEGDPLPERPAASRLAGAAPAGVWDALAQLATADGYTVERGPCGRADGYTKYSDRTVRVRDDVDDCHAVIVLAHEIGHIRADHESRFAGLYATSRQCRGLAEVEAQSVAHLVAGTVGVPAEAMSVPYVAGWAGGDADLLRVTAARVITTARGILTDAALMPPGIETPAPTTSAARVTWQAAAGRWAPATAHTTPAGPATTDLRLTGR